MSEILTSSLGHSSRKVNISTHQPRNTKPDIRRTTTRKPTALMDLSTPSTLPSMEPRTSTGTLPSTSSAWRRIVTTRQERTLVAGHPLPASTLVLRKDVIQRLRTMSPLPKEKILSCSRRRLLGRYYWRRMATIGLRKAYGLPMREESILPEWKVRSSSAPEACNHLSYLNCLVLETRRSSKQPGSMSKSRTQT
jgi:hypothetical protein